VSWASGIQRLLQTKTQMQVSKIFPRNYPRCAVLVVLFFFRSVHLVYTQGTNHMTPCTIIGEDFSDNEQANVSASRQGMLLQVAGMRHRKALSGYGFSVPHHSYLQFQSLPTYNLIHLLNITEALSSDNTRCHLLRLPGQLPI
jgi:hypothetical protein